jgi:hypothetical protein
MENKTSETTLPVTFILPDVEQLFDNVPASNVLLNTKVTFETDSNQTSYKKYSLTTYPEGLLIVSKGHRTYFLAESSEKGLYKLIPGMYEYCRNKNACQLCNVTIAYMEHIEGNEYNMATYSAYPANFVTINGEHYYKIK